MTATQDYMHDRVREWSRRHLSRARARLDAMLGDAYEVGSTGAEVRADDGRVMLNLAGYGVQFLGALHPRVVAAVADQLTKGGISSRVLGDWLAPQAASALVSTFARRDLTKVHFVNSGAEATEAALKLTRAHGVRHVVVMEGGFHGKTMGALSLTANPMYQEPFRPLLPDVHQVPFGDVASVSHALESRGPAAVFVEPVLGEAGVLFPPEGFLGRLSDLCRRRESLLVVDEIQTGLGRTGVMWAHETDPDCRPDILLTGKILSGGLIPVAAMVTTEEVYTPFDTDPLLHTSTYACNALAMRAAIATVEVLHDEALDGRAARVGSLLGPQLRAASQRRPDVVRAVRGRGCLWGIECHDEGLAGQIMIGLMDQGILVNHSLNAGSVIRLTPSAYFSQEQVESVGRALAVVLDEMPVEEGV
ncbi:MAG: aminotransferase class III-fold pyridoxal phosphate-dependent enzyme [Micrococcus sp.]|nr:aminotransferase class III-fold pyridoxal phosphate-dependent enzyme [Micrococcus sp.]